MKAAGGTSISASEMPRSEPVEVSGWTVAVTACSCLCRHPDEAGRDQAEWPVHRWRSCAWRDALAGYVGVACRHLAVDPSIVVSHEGTATLGQFGVGVAY